MSWGASKKRKRPHSVASDAETIPCKKKQMHWSPQTLFKEALSHKHEQILAKDDDLMHYNEILMKAPAVEGYEVKTLLATPHSALWLIKKYSTDIDLSHFSTLSLVWHPKFERYGTECTSHRSIRYFTKDELVQHDKVIVLESGMKDGDMVDFTPEQIILELLLRLSIDFDFDFNSALVNRYENGTEYISKHSDKEVSPGDMVASISFGATRLFRIYDKSDDKKLVLEVPLVDGTLVVMAGNFQNEFKHEIPVQKNVQTPRINVTFRMHRKNVVSKVYTGGNINSPAPASRAS